MVVWCSRVPAISIPFSVGTFVKHLPSLTPSRIRRVRTHSTALAGSTFHALNPRQKEQIHLYVDTLLQWNQKMNLTAVKEADDVMERHIEDSLAILPPIQDSYQLHCNASVHNISVVDVGSGAGLPGLVLAIACPDWQVTLLESMKKRCIFLEHAVEITGLSNVKVVRGRAEDLGQNLDYRGQFDVAVARAVAEMRVLAEYCLPLVRVGGLFVAAKGHDPKEEVKAAETAIQCMGGSILRLCPDGLPYNWRSDKSVFSPVESHSPHGQRTAVVCLKDQSSPRKYPREPGTPAKEPL